jgi:hypothetical protein
MHRVEHQRSHPNRTDPLYLATRKSPTMDTARQNEAMHLLRRASRTMVAYVAEAAQRPLDAQELANPNVMHAAAYYRVRRNESSSPTGQQVTPATDDIEMLLAALVHDRGGTLIPTSPDAEVDRLLRTAAGEFSHAGREAAPVPKYSTWLDDAPGIGGSIDDGYMKNSKRARHETGESTTREGHARVPVDVIQAPSLACDFHVRERRVVPWGCSLIYGGVIGMKILSSSRMRDSKTQFGRFVTDMTTGDMFAAFHLAPNLSQVVALRNNGLNRLDRHLFVCSSESLITALASRSFVVPPEAVLTSTHSVELRECVVCHAPAEPGACECTEIQGFHDLILSPSYRMDLSALRWGGTYKGHCTRVSRTRSEEDGTLDEAFRTCLLLCTNDFPDDQTWCAQSLVGMFIQQRLIPEVPAPMSTQLMYTVRDNLNLLNPGSSPWPHLSEFIDGPHPRAFLPPVELGLLDCQTLRKPREYQAADQRAFMGETVASAAIAFRIDRVALKSSCESGSKPLNEGGAAQRKKEGKLSVNTSKEEMKEKLHYERKLRNREAALRSNKKRSENYKRLIADVASRRELLKSLHERELLLKQENNALREQVAESK